MITQNRIQIPKLHPVTKVQLVTVPCFEVRTITSNKGSCLIDNVPEFWRRVDDPNNRLSNVRFIYPWGREIHISGI